MKKRITGIGGSSSKPRIPKPQNSCAITKGDTDNEAAPFGGKIETAMTVQNNGAPSKKAPNILNYPKKIS